MAILNEAELAAQRAIIFADNKIPKQFELADYSQDEVDSNGGYASVMIGANKVISATTTPTKFSVFDSSSIPDNPIFVTDAGNGTVKVQSNCRVVANIRGTFRYAQGTDLVIELYVGGAPSVITPLVSTQKGEGTSNPLTKSVSNFTFFVPESTFTAGESPIELYFSVLSGSDNVTIDSISLELSYDKYSIRTLDFL